VKSIKAYNYGCLMAEFPEHVADSIIAYGLTIDEDDIYYDGTGEHGRESEIHITVKYGFIDASPFDVLAVQDDPMMATLQSVTLFENERYDVLKIDVFSPDIHELNYAVTESFETKSSFPVYHPHVTIAYLKSGTGKKYLTDRFKGVDVKITDLKYSDPGGTKTGVTLQKITKESAPRIAAEIADYYINQRNIADKYPDNKTEFQMKIKLSFDDSEYVAQQEFLTKLEDMNEVINARIVFGEVDELDRGLS
jgi:2'-5' RNA ligase